MTLREEGLRFWVFGLRPSFSIHTSTRMVLFEVNLTPREKTVKSNIYIRKRKDTTRIKKELQEFANDFEVMKNEPVDAKWNLFQQRLTGIMDSCIPHKYLTP